MLPRLLKFALIPTVLAAPAACDATMPKVGDAGAKTVVTGSAGGESSQNASTQLEKCAKPLGTVALVEDSQADWYKYLTGTYKLTSTVPVLKLMVQQSNCFIVLDRGKAFEIAQRERALQNTGELRDNSNFGKGQMVSADYSLSPEILFSQRGTGGGGAGALIGMFVPYAGLVAGAIQTNEAATMLTLVDNRSGVQVAAAEGSSKNTDFSLGGIFGGAGGALGMGGYSNTPQGKVIAAAFMNSFNQMVIAARSYKPQTMEGQAIGTGGKLAVDGAQPAPARHVEAPAPQRHAEAPTPRSGPAVRDAQVHLVKLGYDIGGKPDGQLGRMTVQAIKELQKDRNLPVNGALDTAAARRDPRRNARATVGRPRVRRTQRHDRFTLRIYEGRRRTGAECGGRMVLRSRHRARCHPHRGAP